MVHITSREQVVDWHKDKSVGWTQVIAARAAQRALPYAFVQGTPDDWVSTYSLVPFRSTIISWGACSYSEYPLDRIGITFGETANTAASEAINFEDSRAYSAIYAVGHAVSIMIPEAVNKPGLLDDSELIANLKYALSNAVAYAERAVGSHVVRSIHHDCNWLETAAATHGLTGLALWTAGSPYGWNEAWSSATNRLLALDPTYQVWIDWYNRRIEGHEAAFDIPGDIDRTHDKAILARLANATDADFWGKGATYVNTMLQGWIDEARIAVRIDEITAKLRGGASAHYGAHEDLAGRAALLDELDRLLGKSPQARHGIGGNHPPEPIDAPEQALALPEEMRAPMEAISAQLEKHEPDALVVVEQVKLLHRVGLKLEKMAGIAGDEFAKTVGGELGKWAVKGSFWLILINQILDWLAPLIR